MKLTNQVGNFSSQDTHNLMINSPCQNLSYELLQFNHRTKWVVLNNNEYTIQSSCINIWLSKANKHMHTKIHNCTVNLNPTKGWMNPDWHFILFFLCFYSANSRRSGWVCKTPWRRKQNRIIHTVSFSQAHAHTDTHCKSMHSMIHQSSGVCSYITCGWVLFLGWGSSLFTGKKHAKVGKHSGECTDTCTHGKKTDTYASHI